VIEIWLSRHRQVFLGRACEKQGKPDEATTAYKAASKIKPDEELAWKGLLNVYENQSFHNIQEHSEASLALAKVYMLKCVKLEKYYY